MQQIKPGNALSLGEINMVPGSFIILTLLQMNINMFVICHYISEPLGITCTRECMQDLYYKTAHLKSSSGEIKIVFFLFRSQKPFSSMSYYKLSWGKCNLSGVIRKGKMCFWITNGLNLLICVFLHFIEGAKENWSFCPVYSLVWSARDLQS